MSIGTICIEITLLLIGLLFLLIAFSIFTSIYVKRLYKHLAFVCNEAPVVLAVALSWFIFVSFKIGFTGYARFALLSICFSIIIFLPFIILNESVRFLSYLSSRKIKLKSKHCYLILNKRKKTSFASDKIKVFEFDTDNVVTAYETYSSTKSNGESFFIFPEYINLDTKYCRRLKREDELFKVKKYKKGKVMILMRNSRYSFFNYAKESFYYKMDKESLKTEKEKLCRQFDILSRKREENKERNIGQMILHLNLKLDTIELVEQLHDS